MSGNHQRTVFLADRHEIVRRGARVVLERETDYRVSGEAADGTETLREAIRLKPDLVIMDYVLPEMNGAEVSRELKTRLPDVKILIYSTRESRVHIPPLIRKRSIDGFVLKCSSLVEFSISVQSVMEGKTFFPPDLLPESKGGPGGPGSVSRCDVLTPREREILQLITSGMRNREVAEMLCISVRTVEKHREHLMRKLGFQTVQELTRYALSRGFIH